jgi:WS/DGAT/MGAT family acyltransferase
MRFSRFRQRALQTPTGSYWVDDPRFDIDAHVRRVELHGAAGKAELETLASDLIATPLDPSRPMWQFDLIEGYERGSAVVVRIHHCYADGIALIQVMLSMTDADREGHVPGPVPSPPKRPPSADGEAPPLAAALKMAGKMGSVLIEKGAGIWHDPGKAVALARQGSALAEELAQLVMMGEDSRTCFKGQPGVAKRVAWADPIAVAEVKAVGRALDCSINDVLLSSVAGALRSYLMREGENVEGLNIRALVPVNLRPAEQAWKLGNRFGLVFLDLPVGIENPVERLYAVRENMRALKSSYQPVVSLGIIAAMGVGPKILQEQLLAMLAKNATAVMTNVPGPQQPLYLGGAMIDSMMFWVPQSGDIGLGVSILSYNGEVRFGVVADRGLCPDPRRVIERFVPEFEKLVMATLLSPWPWEEPPSAAQMAYAVSL